MQHHDIRSLDMRQCTPVRVSGLVTALRSVRADPKTRVINPSILDELERLDFIRQTPWARAITLKGEAFLMELSADLPRPAGNA